MRVLHVVHGYPPDALGGTEVHVQTLAVAQREAGADVEVLARVCRPEHPDLSLEPAEVRADIVVHPFNHHGRAGRSFIERVAFAPAERAFQETLARAAFDVIHVHHLAWWSSRILSLAREAGARVVLTVHDHALACPRGQRIRPDLEPCPVLDRERCARCVRPAWIEAVRSGDRARAWRRLLSPTGHRQWFAERDAIVREALGSVDVFLAPSRSAADHLAEFFPPVRDRVTLVPHGIESWPDRGTVEPALQRTPLVVGFFGAVLPSKGPTILAEAAALAAGAVRVEIHGGGDPALLRRCVRLGRGFVSARGPYSRAELPLRFAAVDAVAVPSLWPETFGLVVREAWRQRRPVVASAIGAFSELNDGGVERALLVPPADPRAWALALQRLAADAALFRRLCGPFSVGTAAEMAALTLLAYAAR